MGHQENDQAMTAGAQRVDEIGGYHDEECTLRANDCCDTCLVLARLRAVEGERASIGGRTDA